MNRGTFGQVMKRNLAVRPLSTLPVYALNYRPATSLSPEQSTPPPLPKLVDSKGFQAVGRIYGISEKR
jgi:hypothetical protein